MENFDHILEKKKSRNINLGEQSFVQLGFNFTFNFDCFKQYLCNDYAIGDSIFFSTQNSKHIWVVHEVTKMKMFVSSSAISFLIFGLQFMSLSLTVNQLIHTKGWGKAKRGILDTLWNILFETI